MTETTLGSIVLNGEERALAPQTTLGALLRELALDPRMVVVERNRVIVREKESFDSLELLPGDALEIVHFVGGG